MSKTKQLLFSLGPKDFEVQTFCTGGNGGQHRNAKKNGVRIIHKASGASAEHRDGRDQGLNRKAAFEKLVKVPKFVAWHKLETAKRLGMVAAAEEAAEKAMAPGNLKTEVKNSSGLWEECTTLQ